MHTELLPVRPDPANGEALHSFVTRLSHANGMRPRQLLPRPSNVHVSHSIVEKLALVSGLSRQRLVEMTLDVYPPSICGTAATGGWRLNRDDWTCPSCTPTTGIIRKDWALAMHPVCLECRVLLTRTPDDETHQAGEELVAVVENLIQLASATVTSQKARVRVRRLNRVCALIAQSIDESWPTLATELPLNTQAARAWGRFPTQDPATVAAILLAVAPTFNSAAVEERLVVEGLRRLHGRTDLPPRRYLPTRRARPRPKREPIADGYTCDDGNRLKWLEAQLARLKATSGLAPRHVPALLCLVRNDPLFEGNEWPRRAQGAIALHMLLSSLAGRMRSDTAACTAFGSNNTHPSSFVNAVALGRGIKAPDADLLLGAAEHLVAGDLIDYQRRRDILRVSHGFGSRLNRVVNRLPSVGEIPAPVLARGWQWVHLTRGPMYTSNTPLVPIRDVMDFADSIDPEILLELYEHGTGVLGDVDLAPFLAKGALNRADLRRRG